jgi:hypothetical protein
LLRFCGSLLGRSSPAEGENQDMKQLLLMAFLSLISPAFADESLPVVLVLEDTQIQHIKGDDAYMNLQGAVKNEIYYLDGTQQENDPYHHIIQGYILKSKCRLFDSKAAAEAYLKNIETTEAKKVTEAAKKKADVKKAEQDKKAKTCSDSGAVVTINNWTWGRSYGDTVSVEGLLTNVSGTKLDYVKVVALFFDQNNTFISSAWGYTTITTIMPYQSSPFRFSWLGANPLAKSAQIKILDRQDNEISACSLK